jgi:tetratricopeptide (TPR) repeat protein
MLVLLVVSCASGPRSNIAKPKVDIRSAQLPPTLHVDHHTLSQLGARVDQVISSNDKEAIKFLGDDLFFKAYDASVRGEAGLAVPLWRELVKLRPDDTYLKRKYAVELIRHGDLANSLTELESIVNSEKKFPPNVALILGGVYTALKMEKKAQEIYQRVVKSDPKNIEAHIFLAKTYAAKEQFKAAIKILKQCQKRVEPDPIFPYYMGKIEVARGNRKQARRYFHQTLKIDSSYSQAAIALGLLHEEQGEMDKAITIYSNFLKVNPTDYIILNRIVNTYFTKGELKKVIPYASQLSSLDPSNLNLKVKLGILYSDDGQLSNARKVFHEILDVVPDSDKILYYLGSIYQQERMYEGAMVQFAKIVKDSPMFHDGQLQIAVILELLANEDRIAKRSENIKRFENFIAIKSKLGGRLEIDLNVILAGFYENSGSFQRAIDVLNALSEREEFDNGHHYYLASLYEKDQQFVRATEIIKGVLKRDPKNAHALNFLGYSLLEQGDKEQYNKAFDYINQAVTLRPKDGYIRDSLGWYYYKVKNFSQALIEAKKAWESEKNDVVITKHLAMIYLEMKRFKEAKQFYVEALKNCTQESEKVDIIKALEQLERVRLPASIDSSATPKK